METGIGKIDSRQPYNCRYIQKLRALEAQLAEGELLPLHKAVQCQPAHVVAGGLVLGTGIAQPHQQPFHAAATVPVEKQGSRLLADVIEIRGLRTQSSYYNTVRAVWKVF